MFNSAIKRIENIACIIHGCANGADSLASEYAKDNFIPEFRFPADWRRGKTAGIKRNIKMLEIGKPTLVMAFPGGRGTGHMVSIARAEDIDVVEIAE
jgi:hypothetical protein